MIIYHNPRCGKSREALAILEDNGVAPEIKLYLKDVPSQKEIKELLKKLKMEPLDIVRKGEKLYKEQYKGQKITASQWIKILATHPILIERPIVVKGNKAVVGRPPENIRTLLKK